MAEATKTVLAAVERYRKHLARGDFIVRDASGQMFWQSSGKPAALQTVRHMIACRQLFERDTDIFGDRSHGQTIGKELCNG